MPEPTAPHASATTRPEPVLIGFEPPSRPASAAPRRRGLRTRISCVRVALIAGAAATARVIQLRRIVRH